MRQSRSRRDKAILIGVSETDSSTEMAILEAEPGVLCNYIKGNKDVEASGQIIGSEEFKLNGIKTY